MTRSRLMRLLRPDTVVAKAAPDPADMGTCFGLELSFDDAPIDGFARRPTSPAGPETAARRWPWQHSTPWAL
jgi:hypothetical protein